MLGAIAGDIIGSVYESRPIKTTDFPLFRDGSVFTDDTVLTVAVADALLTKKDYAAAYREYFGRYPHAGYGGAFRQWARSPVAGPYGSWGNGSAMRVSPVAWAFESLDSVITEAERTAAVTHNHPEGIRGAQATAAAVYLARTGSSKDEIRDFVTRRFTYDLSRSTDETRPGYRFDVSSQGTVPAALRAFLDADGYETAVRLAVSLGGDSDTLACIAGAVAEPFYGGLPAAVHREATTRLDPGLRAVVRAFSKRYGATPET